MRKSTTELLNILKKTKDISNFVNNEELISKQNLSAYLDKLIKQKHLKKSDIIKKSGLDRSYAYDIFAGKKVPSRDKVLALCFAMKLDIEEIQALLKSTGYAILYPRMKRDSILLFAIQEKKSLYDTNMLLYEMHQECLS